MIYSPPFRGIWAGGAGGVIARFAEMAQLADSQGAYAGDATDWYPHCSHSAFLLSGQRLRAVLNGGGAPYFGYGGITSVTANSTYLPQVVAAAPGACLIILGTNDYGAGMTSALSADTILGICDDLLSVGIVPVLGEIFPLPSGQAAKSAWIVATNALLAAGMADRPGGIYVDWNTLLDPDNDGVADGRFFSDTVHLDSDAHYLIGPYLHEKVEAYINGPDPYDEDDWVTSNPLLSGGGTVATGWTVTDGVGKTVVKSLVARASGLGQWQSLVVSGDAAVATSFDFGGTDPGSGYATGDIIEGIVEFETEDDLSDTSHIQLQLYRNGASVVRGWSQSNQTLTLLERMPSGTIVTPRYIVPSGTTSFLARVFIVGTGTYRIGRIGARKVGEAVLEEGKVYYNGVPVLYNGEELTYNSD